MAHAQSATHQFAALAKTASESAKRIFENAAKGRLGERLAGIGNQAKRAIDSLSGTAARRIPDALDRLNKTLTEVKNYSGLIRYTNQIKDFVLWAQQNGYRVILWVKDPSQLAGELQELWKNGTITVQQLPPPPTH